VCLYVTSQRCRQIMLVRVAHSILSAEIKGCECGSWWSTGFWTRS
jgi:hypothetical protein